MIRLLHTADIHLGRQFPFLRARGKEYRNQLLRTFEKIVDLAINKDVSILLISGDLFDTNRVYGIIIRRVLSAFEKLRQRGIRVCILPGTHDVYDEGSIYRTLGFPSNVTVFSPENDREIYEDLNLTVYGKAFDGKLVSVSPIQELSLVKESRFHIGMAHCSIRIEGLVEKDTMILNRSEIAESGFDYLALGHWHSFQDWSQGNTIACYSGSPEPISMDQKGAGSVVIVTIYEKGDVEVAPVTVGSKRFEEITMDIGPVKSLDSIIEVIEAKADPNLILEVTLAGLSGLDYDISAQEIEEQLGEEFFSLRVLDKSHPKLEEVRSENFPEETVTGKFIRIVEGEIAKASDEEEKALYEEALKLGFALLQGRLQVME